MKKQDNITQDNCYQIMITENDKLIIDCYYNTLKDAAMQFEIYNNNFIAQEITITLYFRYYYYYVDLNNKVIEKCEHVLIDKIEN